MAITAAALQTALGDTINAPKVMQAFEPSQGSNQQWLIHGNFSFPGRVRLVDTTASDNAATQAAAVLVAMA